MDDLFNKAKEMAQDPANQERIKDIARERFGHSGSTGADRGEGDSTTPSSEESQTSDSFATEGVTDTSSTDAPTSYDSSDSAQTDDPTMDQTHEAEKRY